MPKQIFLLYCCDEWKSNTSLICASTSANKVKNAICKLIKEKDMVYWDNKDESPSVTKQIQKLTSDFKALTRDRINDNLQFGFFDYAYDGEII